MHVDIKKNNFYDKEPSYDLQINGVSKSEILNIIDALQIAVNKNQIHSAELYSTEKVLISTIAGQISFVLNKVVK